MQVSQKAWRITRLLTVYRIVLALLLMLLITTGYLPEPLGASAPRLFLIASSVYVVVTLLAIYPLLLRTPDYTWQVYFYTCVDILVFTLMMHASGGVVSGVGMLLVVSIANASMLLAGRMSVFFAALASLAVLGEQFYSQIYVSASAYNYSMAGLLGLTLIVTSVLATVLARQARESADLAHARGVDLANMSELTEQVISQMATGVLVVDERHHVRLVNEAARRLLDAPSQMLGTSLQQFSTELNLQLLLWRNQGLQSTEKHSIETLPASLLVQMIRVGRASDETKTDVLIFLEDAAAVNDQSQQLRLAALGRLTAGIAHEIRNPLSAIRHAGELLAESDQLPVEDQRLTDIIQENTSRVNRIVEDVLQLGNRDRVSREKINLNKWLENFVEEIYCVYPEACSVLKIDDQSSGVLTVQFDSGHLHQILSNLCQNALSFVTQSLASPRVTLLLAGDLERGCYVEVINNGPLVKQDEKERLFEPFFTTTNKGTGLGLYLSRELAQANQCHLAHRQQDENTCFRLSFGPQAIIRELD
ncbi:sensor histidine kinase [Nitrincola sp. A-D6]|uniref:sensor histidine kinase n=1 Tax=Nitrincola sp. A-D6 TaxID=1545442 RepID=UPI00068CED14|nr:histidine kinase dimerization/phospho-acceptor domain-containing protein [Nitrincola sp. A-D6]